MSGQLKKFIEEIRNNPEINCYDEATVEHAIITPLLKELGWGVSNMNGIKFRHSTGKDKVDYALMVNGEPRVFIEVKRSGLQIDIDERKQLLNYADYQGVELAILTNGLMWEFYLPLCKGSWEARRFYVLDICRQDLDDIVSKFFDFLERSKIEKGEAIKNAEVIKERYEKEKLILKTLPEAWKKITDPPDETLIKLLQDRAEAICGYMPTAEQITQFLKKSDSKPIQTPQITMPQISKKELSEKEKLPAEQLRYFIIGILIEFGGKASPAQVINEIEKRYKISQRFSGKDSTGDKWIHAIHSERMRMVNVGFIDKNTERGIWQLTNKAKEWHEKCSKNY